MSSLQSNQSSRDLPKILFVVHLLLTLIINFVLEKPYNFLSFLGTIAGTIGASIIVIISYILLSKHKINKTGTYIFIAVQLIASSGRFCSILVHFTPNYYILGILCGVVSNGFYIASMLLLLSQNVSPSSTNQSSHETTFGESASAVNVHATQICSNCGQPLPSATSNFCANCGHKIIENSPEPKQNKPLSPSVSAIENESEKRVHVDFLAINQTEQQIAKRRLDRIHINPKETILEIAKIKCLGFSSLVWICSLAYWCLIGVICIASHHIDDGYSTSYYLLGIEYAYEPRYSGEIHYWSSSIFQIVLLILLLILIPVAIMLILRSHVVSSELALTDRNIHLAKGENVDKIPLQQIQSIDRSPCPFCKSAEKVSISLTSDTTINIYGVTNAKDFIEKSMIAYKNSKSNINNA